MPPKLTALLAPGPLLLQLEVQLLHRKRTGATDGLTKEQKRLHLAGSLLHGFCTSSSSSGGMALSGSNLIR